MRILRFLAVFALVFQLVSPVAAMTGNSGKPAHYLALGDSLAAGMIQDGSIGVGYADYLAEELEEEGLLASYNKGFAYPGYKTTNILEELAQNIEKPSSTTGEKVALRDEIKKADVITISIGANDVLGYIQRDASGNFQFDTTQITTAIGVVAQNIDKILKEITAINPTADVFVMGYYNPFPYLTDYSLQLNYLASALDQAVKAVVVANETYFVEIFTILSSNTATYLPNPANIHPSEAGYAAIAEAFEEPVKDYIMLTPLPEVLPDPVPSFTDVNGWAVEYVGKAASYGFVKGYADGTFKPNNKLTRVHMTSIVARSLHLQATKPAPFKDILKYSQETQAEIAAAFEAGLLGQDGDTFKPSEPLSRVEVARMLYQAHTSVTKSPYMTQEMAPFTDMGMYSKEDQLAMTMLYDLKIATGDQGRFKPASTITRAQASKMIANFYENIMQ